MGNLSRRNASAYIWNNSDYYLKMWARYADSAYFKGWNCAALCFGVFWMFYRGMNKRAIILLSIHILAVAIGIMHIVFLALGWVLPWHVAYPVIILTSLAPCGISVYCGAFGNKLYKDKIDNMLAGTEETHAEDSADASKCEVCGAEMHLALECQHGFTLKYRLRETAKVASLLLLLICGLVYQIDADIIEYHKESSEYPVVITKREGDTTSVLILRDGYGLWHHSEENATVLTLADGAKILGLIRYKYKIPDTYSPYNSDYDNQYWTYPEFYKFDKDWNYIEQVEFDNTGFVSREQANNYMIESGRKSFNDYETNIDGRDYVCTEFRTGPYLGKGHVRFLDVDFGLIEQSFRIGNRYSWGNHFLWYMYFYYD